MSDEEYVHANWVRAEVCDSVTGPYLKWSISLGGRGFTRACIPDNWAKSEAEAWSAAAEFTRDRLEEIRQIKREIDAQRCRVSDCMVEDIPYLGYSVVSQSRLAHLESRILARLESVLADLTRGMKA